MGQMYLQRFVYAEGVRKAELDEAWSKGRNHVVPIVAWYDAALDGRSVG